MGLHWSLAALCSASMRSFSTFCSAEVMAKTPPEKKAAAHRAAMVGWSFMVFSLDRYGERADYFLGLSMKRKK
jgi:hypothetical protein